MAEYELVCVARTPAASGAPTLTEIGPIVAPKVSWTDQLNGVGSLTFDCTADRLSEDIQTRFRDLDQHPTEVWLNRDAVTVAAGFVAGYQLQGGQLSVTAPGLLGYLAYMWVTSDLTYTGIDQHTIAKGLVDHWQALSYGHFGIDTSGITTSGVTRTRKYLFTEQHQILQRLLELRAVDDGFDVRVDPATRDLVLSHPTSGSNLTGSAIFDQRNISGDNLIVSVAAGDLASEAFGVGTGTTGPALTSTQSDTALRASYGRTGVSASFDGVTVQGTLDGHTQAMLDARTAPLVVPSPGLIPVADVDVTAFDVGDTVAYSFDAGLGLVDLERRVVTKQVTIDEAGSETMAVGFQ